MRKKNREISVVSMSFLDLLSCALGAVLLLDIIFSLSLKPGDTTDTRPFVAMQFTVSSSRELLPASRIDNQIKLNLKVKQNGLVETLPFQERGVAKVFGGRLLWASKLDNADPKLVHISATLDRPDADLELTASIAEGHFLKNSAYMNDGQLRSTEETDSRVSFATEARVEKLKQRSTDDSA